MVYLILIGVLAYCRTAILSFFMHISHFFPFLFPHLSVLLYDVSTSHAGSTAGPANGASTTPTHEGTKVRNKKLSQRRSPRTPMSPMSVESFDIPQPPGGLRGEDGSKGALDGSNSIPSTPDPTSADTEMEIGQNGMGDLEMDNVSIRSHYIQSSSAAEVSSRPSSSKVRLSGSYSLPPTVIEEPAMEEGDERDTTASPMAKSHSMRLQRSPSPSLQIPSSPMRMTPSPGASPQSLRKTRIAHTRRKGSRGESATAIIWSIACL